MRISREVGEDGQRADQGRVVRDAQHRTEEIFFALPLSKRDYLLGRFAGARLAADRTPRRWSPTKGCCI